MNYYAAPNGPRDELAERIRARLDARLRELGFGDDSGPDPAWLAWEVMDLFATVEDDWDRLDVHTYTDGEGESWLWHRTIRATTKPVQVVPISLPIVRAAPGGRDGE